MADSGGTTVQLVVPGSSVPGQTPPPSHIPFTGFDLATALVLAVLLLAVGAALQLVPRSRRTALARPHNTTSRRTS